MWQRPLIFGFISTKAPNAENLLTFPFMTSPFLYCFSISSQGFFFKDFKERKDAEIIKLNEEILDFKKECIQEDEFEEVPEGEECECPDCEEKKKRLQI